MKKLLSLLFLLSFACVSAEATTVTGTIVDANAHAYGNGTVTAVFIPAPGGATLANVTGSTNSSGVFSITLTDTSTRAPAGAQWQVSVCAYGGVPCASVTRPIVGTSVSLTAALNAVAPVINGTGGYASQFGASDIPVNVKAAGGQSGVLIQVRDYLGNSLLSLSPAGVLTVASCTGCSGGGTPGGADTNVQFNNAGAFGGNSNFDWNNATKQLTTLGAGGYGTPVVTLGVPFASLSAEAQSPWQDYDGTIAAAYQPLAGIGSSIAAQFILDQSEASIGGAGSDALNGFAAVVPTTNHTGFAVAGVSGWAFGGGTGNLGGLQGVTSLAEWDGIGTLTDAVGFEIQANVKTAGTVTRNAGIHVADMHGVGTNNYGIRVDDQGTGAGDYSIYSAGGKNTFLGALQLGTSQQTTTDTNGNFTKLNGLTTPANFYASPTTVGGATQTAQTASITATTLFTVGGSNAMFNAKITVNCDATVATATISGAITYTDPASQSHTIAVPAAAACTTLGTASVAYVDLTFRAKTATAIQYSTTAANSPNYDVSAVVYQLSTN